MVTKLDNISSIPDINNIGVSVYKTEEEIAYLTSNYIRELSSSQSEYNENQKDLNIFDFLKLVKICIETRQNTEGVPVSNRINFFENDPPNVIDNETIAFDLQARIPGQMNQAPLGRGTIREVTPHIRSIVQHPTIPNNKLITYGKYYEDLIHFYTYAREVKTALIRALWFEKLMDSFHWCFRLHGFRPIEEGIGKKEIVNIGESEIVKYTIGYRLRSDDTFNVTEQELRKIIFDFNVSE